MSVTRWIAGRENGWTGGQYSLFRVIFGLYLAIHFAQPLPWGPGRGVLPSGAGPGFTVPSVFWISAAPAVVSGVLVVGLVLSLLFAAGVRARLVALVLWWVWASLFTQNPLSFTPGAGLPYVGWLLIAHAFLAPRPYGSVDGRGQPDAGASWRFSQPVHLASWLVLAAGYSYSGYRKLLSPTWLDGRALTYLLESDPLARPGVVRDLLLALPEVFHQVLTWGALGLQLLFLPLAFLARVRPWLWSTMLLLHLGLITLLDVTDVPLALVMVHLFTFDPAWVSGRKRGVVETLFYDGDCGLCHRAVRFVLSEDRGGDAIRFAPLQGETFRTATTDEERAHIPDSLVLKTNEGTLLTRSDAVLHLLKRLGGLWRLLAGVGGLIPRPLRDLTYDGVAKVRHRLFAKPNDSCPIVPRELRVRFDP